MAHIQPARGKFWWEGVCWWLNNIFYSKGEWWDRKTAVGIVYVHRGKSKTENKQNETAGINETKQMIKRSTKQKIVQDNSWIKYTRALIIWCWNGPDNLKRPSHIRPKRCLIYMRNKHLTHTKKIIKIKLMLYLGLTVLLFKVVLCNRWKLVSA